MGVEMLEETKLFSADGINISSVVCDGAHKTWSAEEELSGYTLVLVRQGSFQRMSDGAEAFAEPLTGYVETPGSVQRICHPAGGDVCTLIGLDERPDFRPYANALRVHPTLDVSHRLLLKRIREGVDADELVELAVSLVAQVLGSTSWTATATAAEHRTAAQVREVIRARPELRLVQLARLMGTSMYRLSRMFKAATGCTVSRYRIQVRTQDAIDRLEQGESDLARLAAETGFADQAHMTRTLRSETELTPGMLRRLLTLP
jgi:AraC-like DNA-binding protein